MPIQWKCFLIWLLVVSVMIGLQLDPMVCSSDESRVLSLFVGYVVVSLVTVVLTARLDGEMF